MNVPLLLAGLLALAAASIHGIGGELLVVRKLSPDTLPRTRFGGPQMTKSMIQVSWHIASFAFLVAGVSMVLAATALDDDAAQAVSVVDACAFTAFGAVALGLALARNGLRALRQHAGPVVIALTGVFAWWGAVLY